MTSLAGKVAIVTGSSRGIGQAIPFGIASLHAERLGRDGANVVLSFILANGSDAIA